MDTAEAKALLKALLEASLFGQTGKASTDLVEGASALGGRLEELPVEAFTIASQTYPNQQSDFTERNALRHALGTGLITQELRDTLGSDALAKILAKGAGYLWEARGLADDTKGHFGDEYRPLTMGEKLLDTRLDLNANAVGADTALSTPDKQALIAALIQKAKESKVTSAPSFLESSPGYLVHTAKE